MTINTEEGITVEAIIGKRALAEKLVGLSDNDVDTLVCGIIGIFSDETEYTICQTEVLLDCRGVSYGGRVVIKIRTSKESKLAKFIEKFGIRRLWEYIECDSYIGYEDEEDDTERYLLQKI